MTVGRVSIDSVLTAGRVSTGIGMTTGTVLTTMPGAVSAKEAAERVSLSARQPSMTMLRAISTGLSMTMPGAASTADTVPTSLPDTGVRGIGAAMAQVAAPTKNRAVIRCIVVLMDYFGVTLCWRQAGMMLLLRYWFYRLFRDDEKGSHV